MCVCVAACIQKFSLARPHVLCKLCDLVVNFQNDKNYLLSPSYCLTLQSLSLFERKGTPQNKVNLFLHYHSEGCQSLNDQPNRC